jgi:hypothetical protein
MAAGCGVADIRLARGCDRDAPDRDAAVRARPRVEPTPAPTPVSRPRMLLVATLRAARLCTVASGRAPGPARTAAGPRAVPAGPVATNPAEARA